MSQQYPASTPQNLKRSFHYDYDDPYADNPPSFNANPQPIRQPSANRQLKYKLGSFQAGPSPTAATNGGNMKAGGPGVAPSSPTTPRTPSPGPSRIFSFPRLNTPDDPADLYAEEPRTAEPAKKKRRLGSTIINAAVETVIFTGAVALTAYQIITGKKPKDLDTMDESDDATASAALPRSPEPFFTPTIQTSAMSAPEVDFQPARRTSLSLPTGARPYHRAHTKRGSARGRGGMLGGGGSGFGGYGSSKTSPTKAMGSVANAKRASLGKPEEDDDDVFLRMEEKLKSLITEGQSALKSRVEICDLEE